MIEEIDRIIEKYEKITSKEIYSILSEIVEKYGELSDEIILYIAEKSGNFKTTVERVIEYYPKLSKARDRGYIEICIGKNCRCDGVKERIEKSLGIKLNERVCLGNCNNPKNVKIDGELKTYKNIEELEKILKDLKRGE